MMVRTAVLRVKVKANCVRAWFSAPTLGMQGWHTFLVSSQNHHERQQFWYLK